MKASLVSNLGYDIGESTAQFKTDGEVITIEVEDFRATRKGRPEIIKIINNGYEVLDIILSKPVAVVKPRETISIDPLEINLHPLRRNFGK